VGELSSKYGIYCYQTSRKSSNLMNGLEYLPCIWKVPASNPG